MRISIFRNSNEVFEEFETHDIYEGFDISEFEFYDTCEILLRYFSRVSRISSPAIFAMVSIICSSRPTISVKVSISWNSNLMKFMGVPCVVYLYYESRFSIHGSF